VPSTSASVVIPACNEADHIGGVLDSLVAVAAARPLRIVVVCNGCTDETEAIATSYKGVEVLVSEVASKHTALDLGDGAAGDAFPRFYADGDIRITPRAICTLLDALGVDEPRAAGPAMRYDLSGSPWIVRAFFRTMERLPFNEFWQATHLQGRGIYGTNRAGRSRFGGFPPLRSDDGFFDLLFDDAERVVVEDALVDVRCPTSLGELLRNQTRVVEGHRELVGWMQTHRPDRPTGYEGADGRGWQDLGLWRRSGFLRGLSRGVGLLDVFGYAAVEALTRANAATRRTIGREIRWR